jgi:hypothetical protein
LDSFIGERMGWLLAGILWVVLLRTRHRLKALIKLTDLNSNADMNPNPKMSDTPYQQQVCELSVLRLELGHLRAADAITAAHYTELTAHIDVVLSTIVQQSWIAPQSVAWLKSCNDAWDLLLQHDVAIQGRPPWHDTTETSGSPEPLLDDMTQPVAVPALSREAEVAISAPVVLPTPALASNTRESVAPHDAIAELDPPSHCALEPVPPSTIERALQTVSGWSAFLLPFMVQNIGWFIGGFCFVAGSIFLVSYTTGFAKSLTIFTVLLAYTFLVLWVGYQFCRRRPELVASSRVLLTIGVLLIPLNISAAVRLIVTAMPAAGSVALGCLAVALCLSGLYYAIVFVSGMMDRSLQGHHPQLFISLAAVQIAVPLLALWSSWPVLALMHALLLSLLMYGIVRFLQDWLHAIFVERRKITYYAVGTLVYAGLVSFVHLTWASHGPLTLPPGYYGPFLMLLSGVLFYVDAQLKQWVQRDTFLSRLSFALYGLSIFALFAGSGSSVAQVLTLILAIALYAIVMWQYATLPPLYLLLGCAGWLYHTAVLSRVPFAAYVLASLPALASLFFGSWRALRFRSPVLGQMSYRIWGLAVLGLAGWSISHGQPGWVAMSTSLVVMAIAFLGPRYIPSELFDSLPWPRSHSGLSHDVSRRAHRGAWGYVGILAAMIAVAYTPAWFGSAWAARLAVGLLILAELWTLIGGRQLRPRRQPYQSAPTFATAVWFNGALVTTLLSVLVIVGLGGKDVTANLALSLLLTLSGSILLQGSWYLSHQWLCYGALLCWGTSGIAIKLTYFPAVGSGTTALTVALVIWAILWWIERKPPEAMTLLREHAAVRMQTIQPPVLFGFWQTSFRPYSDVVSRPLQHVMLLLGATGLLQVAKQLLSGELSWGVFASAALGAILSLLVAGRFRWTWLLPLAISLGLGSVLGLTYNLGATTLASLSFVSTLYAVGVWRLGLVLVGHPLVIRCGEFLRLRNDQRALEPRIYWTSFIITCLGLLVPLGHDGFFLPQLELLCSLVGSMVFLWLSAQRFRHCLYAYLLLGIGTFSAILCYLWLFDVETASDDLANRWSMLATDSGLGLTLIIVGLGFWGMSRALNSHLVSLADERANTYLGAADYIYLMPLLVMAAGLAIAAAVQQVGVAWLTALGIASTGQSLAILVLGCSSICLLLANHGLGKPSMSFAGMFGGILTLFWVQGRMVHGAPVCAVGFLEPSCAHQWLTLALIAGGTAYLARYLNRISHWERLYIQPLYLAAGTAYTWALLGTMALFVTAPSSLPWLPWLFLMLSVSLILVIDRLPETTVIRGLGIGLLLTGGVVSALAINGWDTIDGLILAGWAFALWGLGNFGLPRYNARLLHGRIAPEAWPWFGMIILGILLVKWWDQWPNKAWHEPLILGGFWTACAFYLCLMLRHSRWSGMTWLATLLLLGAGVSYNLAWAELSDLTSSALILSGGLGYLAWLNLLLWGASCWRRCGAALAARLAWHEHDLSRPLLAWTLVGFIMSIAGLVSLETIAVLWAELAIDGVPWAAIVIVGGAMTLSCAHRFGLRRDVLAGHAMIASGFCTLLAGWLGLACQFGSTVWGFHLPLFWALWCAVLVGVEIGGQLHKWTIPGLSSLRQPISQWLVLSTPAVMVILGVFPSVSTGEFLLILSLFGGVSAYLGYGRRQAGWLFIAMSTLVIELHTVWFFWGSLHAITHLAAGFALQLAGLTCLAGWLRSRVERSEVRQALCRQQWLLTILALSTWLWHGFKALIPLIEDAVIPWHIGLSDKVMAIAALLLLIIYGTVQARHTRRAVWVYSVAVLSGLLALYVRLLWLGLAPVQVWDTAALIGAAYALFALQRLTQSGPVLRIVMALPLTALATLPFQLNSPQASGSLLLIGILYLSMRRATHHMLPLYLGVVAFNVGLYLWVPNWANRLHLVQFYMIPAAISVLGLLHLHRRDIRPAVLHSVRLATLSVLYASVASDVFLRASVTVFIAALAFSLVGVIVGIALRVRAFLYAGVAFLVINVAGQLLLLFPEQRLGKAVVLLILGTGITGTMIWFNAQRESILQRIRVLRSDLAAWE